MPCTSHTIRMIREQRTLSLIVQPVVYASTPFRFVRSALCAMYETPTWRDYYFKLNDFLNWYNVNAKFASGAVSMLVFNISGSSFTDVRFRNILTVIIQGFLVLIIIMINDYILRFRVNKNKCRFHLVRNKYHNEPIKFQSLQSMWRTYRCRNWNSMRNYLC